MSSLRSLLSAILVLCIASVCGVVACQSPPVPSENTGSIQQADFTNGGFETGALGAAWTVLSRRNGNGTGSGITTFPPTTLTDLGLQNPGGMSNLTSVQSAATLTGIPSGLTAADTLRYPFSGGSAAIVNNQGNNANVNVLQQTVALTAADVDPTDGKIHIRFAAAPVLNAPAHNPKEQPYFFIEVRNTSRNVQLFNTFNFANQPGVGWASAAGSGGGILYTNWSLIDIAPGDGGLSIGDSVEVTVVGAGCAFAAHWGHVYVDAVSTSFPLLSVKVTAPTTVQANTDLTYTVTVKNGGTGAAAGVVANFTTPTVADNTAPQNTLAATFQSVSAPGITCTTPAVGSSGQISCPVGSIGPGSTYTFTVTVRVPAIPGGWTNPVNVNEGTYSVSSSTSGPFTGNLVQTQVTTSTVTNLETVLTDGKTAVNWNTANTYTLTVTNRGPTAVTGATIVDTRPASLSSPTWTCVGTAGGVCGAAMGMGNINTTANLPVGGVVTYTIPTTTAMGTMNANIVYRATATPPAGTVQSVPFNNIGSDTDIGTTAISTLTVNKTGSGTIVSSPVGISCGAACAMQTASFATSSVVYLTAIAPLGQVFTGWSGGGCTGTTNPCAVTLAANTTVNATFTAPTLATSISATSNGNSASLRPGDTVTYDRTLTLPNGYNAPLVMTDTLPTGLAWVSTTAPVVTNAPTCATGCTTPTASGTAGATPTYTFGNTTCSNAAGCTIRYTLTARVAATATRGTTYIDRADATGATQVAFPTVTVIEPNLTVSRTVMPSTALTAGQVITVTVTLANNTGGANAPAFAGVVTLPNPTGTTASGYMAGTCPAATTAFGASAAFTFPAATATLASGATCTFTYSLTVGATAVPNASTTSGVGSVTSKSIPGAAPPAKTYSSNEPAGLTVALAGLPNGTACTAAAHCVSLICHPGDNKCGYPVTVGPCDNTTGPVVCRTGACSTSLVCGPATGCVVDGDCTMAQYCNTPTLTCAPRVVNGQPIPTVTGHNPAVGGMCTMAAAGVVCESRVCDTLDNKCGHDIGQGPCTVAEQATVCRSGACSVSGVCEPTGGCLVDGDCTTAQYCNTGTRLCAPKVPNGEPIPTVAGHMPAIGGTCADNVAAVVCASGACDPADNRCGRDVGHGPCDATNGATVCRSGSCYTSLNICAGPGACMTDPDCTALQLCDPNAHACIPKLADGVAIPTIAGHSPDIAGVCTEEVGRLVCLSGACDPATNLCGAAPTLADAGGAPGAATPDEGILEGGGISCNVHGGTGSAAFATSLLTALALATRKRSRKRKRAA